MKKIIFPLLAVCLLLPGCTREPPEIHQIFWQLNIRRDTGRGETYEQLSLFISAGDPDGIEDLEKIYLLNDKENLYWEINSETWYKADMHGQIWIGSNTLAMHDRSPFPEGDYRIMLQDLGGEYAERSFTLNTPNIKRKITFPEPAIRENTLTIKGESPVYSIWIYDKKKEYQAPPLEVHENGLDIKRITSRKRELNEGFSYYIYVYDTSIKRGLITGPFYYP
ncbi:MAG: hypothetical protein JW881_16465 [Spirochaetales bacterium]|nr:hypothetical protein [Spirochaetales bacterium]